MYKTLFISILSTIFIGCSSTSALKHFKKEEIQAKAMQYTKKADVMIENEPKVLLWVTHLNSIGIKEFDYEKESFLTSVYFVNESNQEIESSGYSFFLNCNNTKLNDNKNINTCQKPISLIEISKNNQLYKNILSKNTWGKYYLVSFEKNQNNEKLTLSLSNSNTNSAEVVFGR